MTPAARVAAAISILDAIQAGSPAEKSLTNWGRANRYAGSSDRAAVRDHVYDALRQRSSFSYLGGSETGRGLMIGRAIASASDVNALFSGEKYAPTALAAGETPDRKLAHADRAVRTDCPKWLLGRYDQSFSGQADSVLARMQTRAPLFLRVNFAKTDVVGAAAVLAEQGILTAPHVLSATALEVRSNPRRVQTSNAYKDGLVDIQDAASQAVVDFLRLQPGSAILDYCAGGGGKALAMASVGKVAVTAFDIAPNRMADLPARVARAGVTIDIADQDALASRTFDLVLCDAPCSGSGAWRRNPQAKWLLTPEKLDDYKDVQSEILNAAQHYVAPTGVLAYATCSLFQDENRDQIDHFLRANPGWAFVRERLISPLEGGDGFYVALLTRETSKSIQPRVA